MIFASRIKMKGPKASDQSLRFIEIKTAGSLIMQRIGDAHDQLSQNFPTRNGMPQAFRSGFETKRKNRTRRDWDKDWGRAR